MRLGPIQRRKECDSERVGYTKGWICGGYGKRKFFDVCLSFVSTRVCGREKGHRGKEIDLSYDIIRLIEGWMEGFAVFIHTPIFTVS